MLLPHPPLLSLPFSSDVLHHFALFPTLSIQRPFDHEKKISTAIRSSQDCRCALCCLPQIMSCAGRCCAIDKAHWAIFHLHRLFCMYFDHFYSLFLFISPSPGLLGRSHRPSASDPVSTVLRRPPSRSRPFSFFLFLLVCVPLLFPCSSRLLSRASRPFSFSSSLGVTNKKRRI